LGRELPSGTLVLPGILFLCLRARGQPIPRGENREMLSEQVNKAGNGEYPRAPVVAVGAVVTWGQRVLLIRRGAEPGRGEWSIPGGKLELGEKITQAAQREIWEECGIEIDVGDVVGVTERIIRDDQGRIRFHYILVDVAAAPAGHPPAVVKARSDALEVRWVERTELTDYALPAETLTVIRRAFTTSTPPEDWG